jgi:predicted transcriptional regulator
MSYTQDIIFGFIKDNPGCNKCEISQNTGIISIDRPLRALVRDDMIKEEAAAYRGKKRYWVIG